MLRASVVVSRHPACDLCGRSRDRVAQASCLRPVRGLAALRSQDHDSVAQPPDLV